MQLIDKLSILADAAKYDVSCASSGAPPRSSKGKTGVGSTGGMGICHSFTPDGRCVSLLKILLTNFCLYDCQYCINRRSSDVPRARFSPEEVVMLTLDLYRRNCISGLFLSSGIIRSADYTMEQLVQVARLLHEEHEFRGYIHLKTIPDADPALIEQAGRYADRLSVNQRTMGAIRYQQQVVEGEARAPKFAPAGQSTQMIVGADDSDDHSILRKSQILYRQFRLKRVYYSAFSPIPHSPSTVPLAAPPLLREHRLYQADFLMRGYGFRAEELLGKPGNLALDIDPKLAWALEHREQFPVDVNRAEPALIARVPGIGVLTARRIEQLRKQRKIRYDDLRRLRCALDKANPFIVTADYRPRQDSSESLRLRQQQAERPVQQMALW
ncbi:biotin synthase [Pseudomonas sp.]|uniref:putative DNA modification/repair radical SAM protein n=1 Tax=Pseudomonas sp. TaxID=306 RepID=UPI0019F5E71D|nr:biotin synthase [Pseudomonas sp.]MBF0674471.1 biotin synthase [Pseudomonas sp.]